MKPLLIAVLIIGCLSITLLVASIFIEKKYPRTNMSNPSNSRAEAYVLPRKYSFRPTKHISIDDAGLSVDGSRVEFGWRGIFFRLKNYSITDLFRRDTDAPRERLCAATREGELDSLIEPIDKILPRTLDDQVEMYRKYTFAAAYSIEDVITAFLAGTIPICSLDLRGTLSDFNPEAYVFGEASGVERAMSNIAAYQTAPIISKRVLEARAPWVDAVYNVSSVQPYQPLLNWRSKGADYIVINLDEHSHRLAQISAQFKDSGRTFERFPAVKGKDIMRQFTDKIRWVHLRPPWMGEIGVYVSDMEILSSLVQEPPNVDYYTVLEDDVTFRYGHIPKPADIVARAPRDWDMIFLGVNEKACKPSGKSEFIKLGKSCMPGAFAFIVRKRFARYLVNFFGPIEDPIDEVYRKESEWFNHYLVNPKLVKPDYSVNSSTSSND